MASGNSAQARPLYEAGGRLAAADLRDEQEYRRQRLRRHNRVLHGWGVVCGLAVVAAPNRDHPWMVRVCPGYALGPHGDEILVGCAVPFDVGAALWQAPARTRVVFIAIRADEAAGEPVPVVPAGCGCPEPAIEPSRVRDGFRIAALWKPPLAVRERVADPCRPGPVACPPCPESPWVPLARVRLPADPEQPLGPEDIENVG